MRDIDTAVVDSLKVLDPNRPIREADSCVAAIGSSFDHFVGLRKQRWRRGNPERLRGLEVNHQLEFRRLHDREIGGLLAFENPAGVNAGLAISVGEAGTVAYQ